EEEEKDTERARNHQMTQLGDADLDALEGAQHGDGRSDDAVTIEEGGSEESQPHEEAAQALLEDQGEEGEEAALAAVVEPHDDEVVLQGQDQDERPQEGGEHAVDGARLMRQAHFRTEASAKGVERAGADVSVDHAQGGERKHAQPAAPRPRSIAWDG